MQMTTVATARVYGDTGKLSEGGKAMQYGEIVTRALAIAWRHKYLWLLALFAGEGAAGVSFSTSFGPHSTSGSSAATPTPAQVWSAVTTWVAAHVLLLVVCAAAILTLWLAFLLLSAVADGALVRASSEHDAGHLFSLGSAWRAGLASFWPVLKVKLLATVVAVIAFIVIGGLAAAAAVSAFNGATATAVILGTIAVLLVLAALPFFIVFSVMILLMVRDAALRGMSTSAALAHSARLMQRRLGRVALLWLLSAALGVAIGIATAIVFGIMLLVFAAVTAGIYLASGLAAAIVAGAILGVLWFGLLLVASGAVMAFTSTYWTLGYTRLDLEPQHQAATLPPAAA
jgi:hypothetical protein